jgi:Universal stress protein family.
VKVGRAEIPIPSVIGAGLTFWIWITALGTHAGARYAGPAWLAAGVVVFVLVRRSRGEGLMEHVKSPDEMPFQPGIRFNRILVPMKLGVIGEEMIATAVKLAQDHGAEVIALHAIRVPLELPLDAPMFEEEERARPRSPRPSCSAPTTGYGSRGSRSAPARSATRSSTRRRSSAPT